VLAPSVAIQFAERRGKMPVMAKARKAATVKSAGFDPYVATLEGTISTPGANKK
jgi:muramidase (phage lysozyme)